MTDSRLDPGSIFAGRFGITQRDLDRLLCAALDKGGDYADLYLEYRTRDMLALEEGMLKSATKNIFQGIGVRVVVGDKTGSASADSLEMNEMLPAAAVAAAIAHDAGSSSHPHVAYRRPPHNLYPVAHPLVNLELPPKLLLLE